MARKTVKVKISDTAKYLGLFNGIFKLTDTEIQILAAFMDLQASLDSSGMGVNAFSTPMKKKVARDLGREDFNTLNVYIKSLTDKKVLSKVKDGYKVHPLLLPKKDEEELLFSLQWTKPGK